MTPIFEETLSVGSKKSKPKKRFVMLDAQSLHVFVDATKKELDDSLPLVFCFVRAVPGAAGNQPTIGVYNKEREVLLAFDDVARSTAWCDARVQLESLVKLGISTAG